MGSAPMVKKFFSHYAPRPWGMQPNTSSAALLPRSTGAVSRSCLFAAYYTTFPFCMFYTFYTAEIGYWQGEGLTTEDEGQRIAVRPARPTISVYSVYFVVQISASFAFFAAEGFTLLNQFYSSSDSSRRASFRAGFLRVSSTAYTFTKPSDSL